MKIFKRVDFWALVIATLALAISYAGYQSQIELESSNFAHRVYSAVDARPVDEQLSYLDTLHERELDERRKRLVRGIRVSQVLVVEAELEARRKREEADAARSRAAKAQADAEAQRVADEEARKREAEAAAAAERARKAREERERIQIHHEMGGIRD